MANFRGERYLEASMRSVLGQSERSLQLIVADDASDDRSVAIARAVAAEDPRVTVLAADRNAGPAVTRNRALDAARGDWIAIVDSDDLIHPQRLARLVAAGTEAGADLVADDLVHFGAAERAGGRTLLQDLHLAAPLPLTLDMYLRGNTRGSGLPSFGYLKPVIRRAVLGQRRYDPALRIGEDYDLIVRLLIGGASFLLLPDPTYAYRRHAGSVSHRLSVETVGAMLAAHRALPPIADPTACLTAAAIERDLQGSLRYEQLVLDIKARKAARVLPALSRPDMWRRLAESVADRRRRARAAGPAEDGHAQAPATPIPSMPTPGAAWASPPADHAARLAAGADAGATAGVPDWAVWLKAATSGSD